MKKRVFILVLTACMILPCFNGLSVTALDTLTDDSVVAPMPEASESDNVYNKLHFYFDTEAHATIESAAELQTATASVKADYVSAQNTMARSGEAAEENVYITVQFASDYLEDETYLELKSNRENAKTALQRDSAKSRQNAYSKSYHQALVTENMPLLSAIPYTDFNVIDYSSFVTLTVPAVSLDPQVLETIAENENILHISLTDGFEVEPIVGSSASTDEPHDKSEWLDVLECINAKDIYESRQYTGNGVKVGIYEYNTVTFNLNYTFDNVCDVTHENLQSIVNDDRFVFRSGDEGTEGYEYDITHATIVVSILTNMLPDATFYFANTPVNTTGQCREGVGWFISQGCDVVNCSFGSPSTTYRYDYDAVYDYQIEVNDITVIVSAGNVPKVGSSQLASPTRAHNVITVGGIEYTSEEGWIHASDSCYLGSSVKPNVVAPYYIQIPNITGEFSGTSGSAPLVTACVAVLYEHAYERISGYFPAHLAMPMLMSSANKTDVYYEQSANQRLDLHVGAGVVNLERILQCSFYDYDLQGMYHQVVKEVPLYVMADTDIQIVLTWLAKATPVPYNQSGGDCYVPDYNIYLYNPSGLVVAQSLYSDGNVELLRYVASVSGTYKLKIVANENVSQTITCGLSISW